MKNKNEADIKLINEIAANNYISYHKLFTCYYNPLCNYIYSLIKDKDDSEDIAQELFFNLWKNRNTLEIQTSVSSYLYKTARNLTLNFIRDNLKYKTALDYNDLQEPYFDTSTLELQEFRRELNDCINRLPQRNKEILLMHRVEKLKQKEISEKLDISVKTIKNQIWMALQRLKNCLSLKGI